MRKIALLSVFVLVFLLGSRAILADEEVPSDLALDLEQAEKNPAPQQQQIIANETPKAEETTGVGKITVQPETQLAPEVAKQPASITDHPEQTTSAQVQETTVPADTSTNQGSTSSGVNTDTQQPGLNNDNGTNTNNSTNSGGGSGDNLVPGTKIVEPDDNAAPVATPSPQTAPSDNSNNNTQQQPNQPADNSATPPASPTPAPGGQPAASPTDQTTTAPTPPPPNDNPVPEAQPTPAPTPAPATDNGSQPQNETPPVVTAPGDAQPDSGNSTNSNDSSGGSAVQGASTERLDLLGKIVNFFRGLIR